MRRFWVGVCALFLAGCASGYSQYYQPAPEASIQMEAFAGDPQVVASSGSPRDDVNAMYSRGYGLIGTASFDGPMENVRNAIEQGKKVGAQYIVVSQKYARTVSGAIPITTFSPETTYSSGTISGGSGSYNYHGSSTTYTEQTTVIPYSIERYDQSAIFFGPLARSGVGMLLQDIEPADAEAAGTNKGVLIKAVRRGSPAFQADLLPRDIIQAVDGAPVYEGPAAVDALKAKFGSTVSLTIWRRGETISKSVSIPADGRW